MLFYGFFFSQEGFRMDEWGKRSKKMLIKGPRGRGKRMFKKKGIQKEEWRNESE